MFGIGQWRPETNGKERKTEKSRTEKRNILSILILPVKIRRAVPWVERSKTSRTWKCGKFQVDMNFSGRVPDGIRRGQTLQIRLQLSERTKALLLPRGGFYQTTGGQWVFLLNSSGDLAVKRNISIGRQNPDYFEVLSGLRPGDRVVTSSYDNFGNVKELVIK